MASHSALELVDSLLSDIDHARSIVTERSVEVKYPLNELIVSHDIVVLLANFREMGVFDTIPNDGIESIASDTIAKTLNLNSDILYRCLRLVASFGFTFECDNRRFRHTKDSLSLRTDTDTMSTNAHFLIKSVLSPKHCLQTGDNAFEVAFGKSHFQWMCDTNTSDGLMDFFEKKHSSSVDTIANSFDFSGIKTICDVGGSRGYVVKAILKRWSNIEKGFLFDLPSVIDSTKKDASVPSNLEMVSGDFFESVPISADIYFLGHVLHDWNDEKCVKILNNIVENGKEGKIGILIWERIFVNEKNKASEAKEVDYQMLLLLGGKERSLEEFDVLCAKCNLYRVNKPMYISKHGSLIAYQFR